MRFLKLSFQTLVMSLACTSVVIADGSALVDLPPSYTYPSIVRPSDVKKLAPSTDDFKKADKFCQELKSLSKSDFNRCLLGFIEILQVVKFEIAKKGT